ncbi:MAG TPA: 50S ribosomal protein L6 [Nitrospirae bacterium]|nr:50S ribosomal protein L6 [bacterium BMS3Abin10]GBE38712.1 50S ribosomal protein L6 [bacterium BMS3Bbin08]HDK41172.1 50S ribosomal protein L6 [Nitrospirota bacterium]HDK82229.1 50S ribosomal protein L6 [Nitrospirota bacterium]
MSRIGKKPINLPKGVDARVNKNMITVKGAKGELKWEFASDMKVSVKEGELIVERPADTKRLRALHGLTRNLIWNMVAGVSEGYQKVLEITGVGYKAQAQGKKLVLTLGYSHAVDFHLPDGITAEVGGKQNQIILKGIDKHLIGQVAANIRALRSPDAYKGKGIRYAGEMVKLKAGKK